MHRTLQRLGAALLAATCAALGVTATVANAAPVTSASPTSVHASQVTRTVSTAGDTFTGPRFVVTGGRPGVARAIAAVLQRRVDGLVATFTREVAGSAANGPAPHRMSDGAVPTIDRSRHDLSVVLLESIDLAGAHPGYVSHAYIFDAATGTEVSVARLFHDPHRADRLIRAALVAGNRQSGVTTRDVARVSIVPVRGKGTSPLVCYPGRTGLHCQIDPGWLLPFAAGPLTATVSWKALAAG